MAINTQDNNTNQTEQEPLSLQDRLLEKATKQIEKNVSTKVDEKLQSGANPQDILRQLMDTIGSQPTANSQNDLLQQITQLASTPVGSGQKQGILRSLVQGQGLTRPEKQKPLGFNNAIDVLKLQQGNLRASSAAPGQKVDFLSDLIDVAKKSGDRKSFNVLTGQDADAPAPTEGIDPFTGKQTLGSKVKEVRALERAKNVEKLIASRQESAQKIETNFNTMVGQFKQLIGQAKGAGEEQGGLGLIPGLLGAINVAFKNPNFSRRAAVPGQIKETSLVFNKILTGQNRVIKGVVQMIQDTLLTTLDPGTTIAAKTQQSLSNAFMIKLAFQKVGLTPDVLTKMSQAQLDNLNVQGMVDSLNMTPEETAQLKGIITDVLETPAVEARELPGFERKGKGKTISKENQTRLTEIKTRRAEIQKLLNG